MVMSDNNYIEDNNSLSVASEPVVAYGVDTATKPVDLQLGYPNVEKKRMSVDEYFDILHKMVDEYYDNLQG